MFEQARIKLTVWYLFIIMLISMIFSIIIYSIISREFERRFRQAQMRLRAEQLGIPFPGLIPRELEEIEPILLEELNNAKKNLIFNLIIINGVILVLSAGASYFLAGKTLNPIEKALNEQKRFVADASHELRTPLTALKTSVEVALRDEKINLAEVKKVLYSNLQDIDGLESLTSNLLSLANLQDNANNLGFDKTNIAEVISKAVKKIKPLAKKKSITIKVDVKKQVIVANKESLEKLLLILLDNAIKYTPKKGKIWINAERSRTNLTLSIKDTGIGIDKKDIPNIFKRFYRTDQVRTKDTLGGFGLGLSVAKEIIKQHKGSVKVESILGKGTTFIVRLPV
ncbi:hypothetical protein A3J78_00115 [Candidatus Beckwithbacteria bacterium RBG_13_35_6]|uniref:histidine kinase n=1 Tax=Candidatus Beckwithbacteria bacterium RBG_13_35_6 TaxID=1797456 RepID=A0A1F5DGV7_9BACT|nr:MAG: hypothetical protein A3J78_00115 [Candidatus Beckwithbacteria bacterium RBG_13_35_6]